MLSLPACAKVNLTLEVLGKRPDGYHEVATVLQTISLHDDLSFEPSDDLVLRTEGSRLPPEENLVLKAARLLQQASFTKAGALIRLTKRIPMAAGLGGGSTDAASALLGLDRLWGTRLPEKDLLALAAQLGSDVPFFIRGGTALAEGRGELITPLPPLPHSWLVLLKPPLFLPGKTGALYRALKSSMHTTGQSTKLLVDRLRTGAALSSADFTNVFESVAFDVFPNLADYRHRLLEAGASHVHLAGSGPTLFTIVPTPEEGKLIEGRLSSQRLEAYLAETVSAAPA